MQGSQVEVGIQLEDSLAVGGSPAQGKQPHLQVYITCHSGHVGLRYPVGTTTVSTTTVGTTTLVI